MKYLIHHGIGIIFTLSLVLFGFKVYCGSQIVSSSQTISKNNIKVTQKDCCNSLVSHTNDCQKNNCCCAHPIFFLLFGLIPEEPFQLEKIIFYSRNILFFYQNINANIFLDYWKPPDEIILFN